VVEAGRAPGFAPARSIWSAFDGGKRYLSPVQMEALDPNDLRDLFQAAINQFWDTSI